MFPCRLRACPCRTPIRKRNVRYKTEEGESNLLFRSSPHHRPSACPAQVRATAQVRAPLIHPSAQVRSPPLPCPAVCVPFLSTSTPSCALSQPIFPGLSRLTSPASPLPPHLSRLTSPVLRLTSYFFQTPLEDTPNPVLDIGGTARVGWRFFAVRFR